MTLRPLPRLLVVLLLAFAALIVAVGWVRRDFALRRDLAEVTMDRDLTRLELRSLKNELAAERLLARHAQANRFAAPSVIFLHAVSPAATAVHAAVLRDRNGAEALLVADALPPLAPGESYVLIARSGTEVHDCATLAAAGGGEIRAVFPWPGAVDTPPPQFSLVRRSAQGGDLPFLAALAP